MKEQPKKFVVLRVPNEFAAYGQIEIAYGPELEDRCKHWVEQAMRIREPSMSPPLHRYEIHEAKIGWI